MRTTKSQALLTNQSIGEKDASIVLPAETRKFGPEEKKLLRRTVAGSVVGNIIEQYDFVLYGSVAALVFGKHVNLGRQKIAIGLFACGRAEIHSRENIGKFNRGLAANHGLIGDHQFHITRWACDDKLGTLETRGDFSPDRNRRRYAALPGTSASDTPTRSAVWLSSPVLSTSIAT